MSNLKSIEIPLDRFENRAVKIREKHVNFESKLIQHLRKLRHNTKLRALVQAEQPNHPHAICMNLYSNTLKLNWESIKTNNLSIDEYR